MSHDAIIKVRTTAEDRDAAAKALAEMGLTISDAVRMVLRRIAVEGALPFEVRVPNPKTAAALEASRAGRVTQYDSTDALWNDADHAEDN
jgi:DNA-damage-inducible protein J